MLCLFSHASWGDSSYCNNNWSTKNPFYEQNNGPLTTPFEFFTNNSGCIIIDELHAHDIDNEIDWQIAEIKYSLLKK